MMRVLHVISCMSTGGAETFLLNLLRYDKNTSVQFDFMQVLQEEGFYEKEVLSYGSTIYRIHSLNEVGVNGMIKEICDILNSNAKYDVVHAHLDYFSGIILSAAKKSDVKVRVAHSHNTAFIGLTKYGKLVGRLAFEYFKFSINRNANVFIACGEKAKYWLFYRNKKVHVLNNAVDLDRFAYTEQVCDFNREQYLRELDIQGKTVLGHVGRFAVAKNHKQLLNIFSNYLSVNPDSVLLLIGTGPLQSEMIQYAAEIGVLDKCRFLGARSDVNCLMHVMDLLLMPSLFEGFPVTLIETQAAGVKALISTKISGEVDLGLGLIKFETLQDNWNESIISFLAEPKPTTETCVKVLEDKGFSAKTSFEKLIGIYSEAH